MRGDAKQQTVHQRLTELIDRFEHGNKSAFGRQANISSGVLGDLVGGRLNKPSFDVLTKILVAYPLVNAEWLLLGEGSMLKGMRTAEDVELATGTFVQTQHEHPTGIFFMEEPEIGYHPYPTSQKEDKVLVVDQHGHTLAPIINFAAAADYLSGYDSQEYYEQLDTLSLPPVLVKGGRHIVFPVIGDSMSNTFLAKDYVLCRELHPNDWQYIKPLTICVVVSKSRGIQLKRVKVRPRERLIRCKSDNRTHHSFNLDFEEVLEIWRFEWRLTATAENVGEKLYEKVDNLEDTVHDLRALVESIIDEKDLRRLIAIQPKEQ